MVITGSLSRGASFRTEMLLSPFRERARVRGIGVAESIRTSTFSLACFILSFDMTPKRCSSSMISRPRSLKTTSSFSMRTVPMSMSISPQASRPITSFCSLRERKREIRATVTGKPVNLAVKVIWCCCARIVVGTRKAVCLPPCAARKAARRATSVFPYPTSPTSNLSIGKGRSMSSSISEIAVSWSRVSG